MSFLENAKQYTGSDLENIFFRPILSGPSAGELGVRVLYNMPVPTTIQLWEGQRNVLQKYTAAGWSGGSAANKLQKTIALSRVKAELGFSAADYFSLVYEKIAARADVNMDDLTGSELEQAETSLFKQAIAEGIRATMWVGDTTAASGFNTFDGFLKSVKAGAEQERFHNSVYEAADFTNPEKIVAILDDLWQNAGGLSVRHLAPQVVLPADRPPQSRTGRQHVRLSGQRSAHVVQPRPDGEPPARRLHGRMRRDRRDDALLRIPGIAMTASTPRKPAGGITAAAITPAGNLLRAALGADGRAEAVFRDGTLLTRLPLAEQRSSYTELSDTQAGPQRVRHTLKLVVSREAARTLFGPAFRHTAATEGLIATVTAASGERLLIGWSARLGREQPLRLGSVSNESGVKPLDGTPVVVTLTCEDTDPAPELKQQEP